MKRMNWTKAGLVVIILALLAIIALQYQEIHKPRASYIACFEGYELGVKIGEELVPIPFAPGESIDPKGLPMMAIYGTYCTQVYP